MLIQHRIFRKLCQWVILGPIFWGLLILTFAGRAHGATIGSVLDNTGATAPGDMYQIPGLDRARQRGEGSYVKTGVGTGSPLTTGNAADWEGKKAASPTIITFPDKLNTNDTGDPNPWFSVNYVDHNGFIDFKDLTQANNFYQHGESNYNASNIKSLMTTGYPGSQTTRGPVLKDGASFDGGFLQVTGNVPIKAQIAGSQTSVDATMAGNWGVMVRVTLPEGIDAKSLGGAIDWGQSYFYLTLQSISFWGIQIGQLNFPLQFDHHVYLDPDVKKTNVFYLKVKGIPFGYDVSANKTTAKMQLQRGTADYLDYLHNRYIEGGQAKTLDNLTASGDTDTTGSGTNIQPQFIAQSGGKDTVWDPFYGLVNQYLEGIPLLGPFMAWITSWFSSSPVYLTGNVGRTVALLNAAYHSADRGLTSNSGWLWRAWQNTVVSPIIANISQYFVTNGFTGTAHINFSFDMSKYAGDVNQDFQAITAGRLMPAPYPDGQFNKGTGLGTAAEGDPNRQAIGIKLYGSNTLVDPYDVLAGKDRTAPNADLLAQMKAGTSPMDYAVIDQAKLETSNQDDARDFPVYSNFSTWTAFVSPFDNSPQKDTLNSSGDPLGSDMRARTARPDSYSDGILVNDGSDFSVDQDYDPAASGPLTKSATDDTLTAAGAIVPQRYAQVYQYYDYSGATPVAKPTRMFTTASNTLWVRANQDRNAAAGYTGQVTQGFPNNQWVYTGKYNNLAMAGATLGLAQDLRPELNDSGSRTFIQPRTAAMNGNTVRSTLGTWRDRLTVNLDSLTVRTYRLGSDTVLGMTMTDRLFPSGTAENLDLHWGDSLGYAITGPLPYGPVTAALQLPPAGSAATDNGFYGTVQIKRNKDVPINLQTAANAANPLKLAAAAPDLVRNSDFLILFRDDTTADWSAAHRFTTTASDTVFFFQDSDRAPVSGTVKNNGTASQQTFQIMLPRVPGTTLSSLTVQTPTGSAVPAANITPLTTNTALDKYYQRYQVQMPSAITQGQTFTFGYTYAPNDLTQMPSSTTLRTVVSNADGTVLAETGALYLKRMSTLAILQTPTLDFGRHVMPRETTTYGLTEASQQAAQLVIQDNAQATGQTALSWTVDGFLSPFTAASGEERNDFTLALGQGVMPADYEYPTDADWRAAVTANHTAAPLPANQQTARLFTMNTLLEPNTNAAPLIIGYPNARLTVPAVTKNGEYSATLTYTVNMGL
ncbi:hypothetical protein [Schleiferilactobacillus shenzhenensis]|uniref:Uncharacterized protein n=1 Tax=Schleiferilactobacillus shenzhenensis LY-73 TaxID=1231336 RepID=U4TLR0_9LACO|nr:hypothetical protein [Schleiferilactobacillus shenzhenensis]ERL65154.1 hypothetical protein L248_3092 [Schleiferilactobacillus shenzhenensis LY-73]